MSDAMGEREWEPDAERAIQTFIDSAVSEGYTVTRIELHRGADHRVYVTRVCGMRAGDATPRDTQETGR